MDEQVRQRARKRRRPLREAASALELAIAAPAGTGSVWRDRVRTRVTAVRAALEDHIIEVEGPGGLAEEIRAEAPRLISLMNRLQGEHGDLREAVGRILETIRGIPTKPSEDQVAAVREAVTSFLGRISRHRQKGADLVYEAYCVDIGGE